MRSGLVLSAFAAFIIVPVDNLGAQCVPSQPDPYDWTTRRRPPPGPGLQQLQALARQYYPGLVRNDAPARITIGFVFDSTCKVLRHSAAFTPDSANLDLMRILFPDLDRGSSGGIADALPPTGGRQLLVAWTMLSGTPSKTAAISGCYRFDRPYFHWVGRRAGDRAVVIESTYVVRLGPTRTTPSTFARSGLDVLPVPFDADATTARRWLGPSYWSLDGDVLNVVWRNGLSGPVFRLSLAGDSLHGRVRFTTDVVGNEPPSQAASAVRIACPSGRTDPPV